MTTAYVFQGRQLADGDALKVWVIGDGTRP